MGLFGGSGHEHRCGDAGYRTRKGRLCKNPVEKANQWCGQCLGIKGGWANGAPPATVSALAGQSKGVVEPAALLDFAEEDCVDLRDLAEPTWAELWETAEEDRWGLAGTSVNEAGPVTGPPPLRRWAPPELEHLRGKNVILLDMDGTLFDSFGCGCGRKEPSYRASKNNKGETCTHLRQDTLEQVAKLAAETDAVLVVLSYRAGRRVDTQDWIEKDVALPHFQPVAYIVPGAPDDCSYQSKLIVSELVEATGNDRAQSYFKARAVDALQREWGANIVGAFDDNGAVCEAYSKLGVPSVTKVAHLVKIEPWEWTAGRIGAPKPPPMAPKSMIDEFRSGQTYHHDQGGGKGAKKGHRSSGRGKQGQFDYGLLRRALGGSDGYGDYGSAGDWDGPDGTVDEFDLAPADSDMAGGFREGEMVHYYWGGRQLMAEVLGVEDGKVVVQDEEGEIIYFSPDQVSRF